MRSTQALILDSSNGLSFFLREILLDQGLVSHVDLVAQAEQAIKKIDGSNPYDLVVINLVDAWEQGTELGAWLSQLPVCGAIVLIVPAESLPHPFKAPFKAISTPLSLQDFTECVQSALNQTQKEMAS